MKHCPKAKTPTAIGVSENGLVTAHKLGCKSWSCPYCSEKRKKYLALKTYEGIERYKLAGIENWYFGTLTMHRKWRGWASLENYYHNWNKFYQRMKRDTEGKLLYVLLPERHQDGSLHVHLISTCGLSTHWWHDAGSRSGLGFQNENEALGDASRAAYYVTKYVGKSLGVSDWPTRFRRVRYSIHWPEPEHEREFSWIVPPADLSSYFFAKRLAEGYRSFNLQTGEIQDA